MHLRSSMVEPQFAQVRISSPGSNAATGPMTPAAPRGGSLAQALTEAWVAGQTDGSGVHPVLRHSRTPAGLPCRGSSGPHRFGGGAVQSPLLGADGIDGPARIRHAQAHSPRVGCTWVTIDRVLRILGSTSSGEAAVAATDNDRVCGWTRLGCRGARHRRGRVYDQARQRAGAGSTLGSRGTGGAGQARSARSTGHTRSTGGTGQTRGTRGT